MPEGPEIRYLKEVLQNHILNKTLLKITAYSKKRVYIPSKSKVIQVGSKGKLLWIRTKEYYIHIHFGMTGWLYTDEDTKPKNIKYLMEFSQNRYIFIESIRKFTYLKIYHKNAHDKKIASLGLDILTDQLTLDKLTALINSKRMNICKFLLDQDKLCGIGNYQKSDVLYLSKIHPQSNTADLSDKQIKKLYKAIKYVAYSSLLTWLKENKIKIPKDIKLSAPKRVKVPYKFIVYDKDTDPYGNKITNITIGGRATYYVKKVQIL